LGIEEKIGSEPVCRAQDLQGRGGGGYLEDTGRHQRAFQVAAIENSAADIGHAVR
jgi:hypothetical protein